MIDLFNYVEFVSGSFFLNNKKNKTWLIFFYQFSSWNGNKFFSNLILHNFLSIVLASLFFVVVEYINLIFWMKIEEDNCFFYRLIFLRKFISKSNTKTKRCQNGI